MEGPHVTLTWCMFFIIYKVFLFKKYCHNDHNSTVPFPLGWSPGHLSSARKFEEEGGKQIKLLRPISLKLFGLEIGQLWKCSVKWYCYGWVHFNQGFLPTRKRTYLCGPTLTLVLRYHYNRLKTYGLSVVCLISHRKSMDALKTWHQWDFDCRLKSNIL